MKPARVRLPSSKLSRFLRLQVIACPDCCFLNSYTGIGVPCYRLCEHHTRLALGPRLIAVIDQILSD